MFRSKTLSVREDHPKIQQQKPEMAFKFRENVHRNYISRIQIKLHILAGLVDPDEGGVFNWLHEVEGIGVVFEEHGR